MTGGEGVVDETHFDIVPDFTMHASGHKTCSLYYSKRFELVTCETSNFSSY